MTVVALDDTDSSERGMCTTYVATQLAATLTDRVDASVDRLLLIRLNPAIPYKTRGNAALAIHTDCTPETAFAIGKTVLESLAESADERTNPGLVVADDDPTHVPQSVASFAQRAVREHLEIDDATRLLEQTSYRSWGMGNGRGRIGALAAVGSWQAFEDWTYEYISYREQSRWGTPRDVDHESVFVAAEAGYPTVWDTVDHGENEAVCVPHTPCPILHGIRGDDPAAVTSVAQRIDSEPVSSGQLFVTNQGTDAHIRRRDADGGPLTLAAVENGHAYRLEGRVETPPETRRGGHVFLTLTDGEASLECAAFEPTKRFRDWVRALRVGDDLVVYGEVARNTLKLEKFAVCDLVRTERVTPTCEDCGRTMKSAGRNQGYRCRPCGTTAPEKVERPLERDLEIGWYEVPPCARRHLAKPLLRMR